MVHRAEEACRDRPCWEEDGRGVSIPDPEDRKAASGKDGAEDRSGGEQAERCHSAAVPAVLRSRKARWRRRWRVAGRAGEEAAVEREEDRLARVRDRDRVHDRGVRAVEEGGAPRDGGTSHASDHGRRSKVPEADDAALRDRSSSASSVPCEAKKSRLVVRRPLRAEPSKGESESEPYRSGAGGEVTGWGRAESDEGES